MKVPTDLKQLTDLREKGAVSFFEVRGRELVLYWRELAPEQRVTLTVDLVCDVPGEYRGPASRAYLYYTSDHKHWVEPLAVKIRPAGPEDPVVRK
jgi:alpha-2-macroglobulin-like protein